MDHHIVLDFPAISDCARIRVNGWYAGDLMENGRYLDVTGVVRPGDNKLEPTGIMEIPVLKMKKRIR